MGAKDWMLFYADSDDIDAILRSSPTLDRGATTDLVRRLFSSRSISEIEDGSLSFANPADDVVYAGCFPGLTVVCTSEAAVDHPSCLDRRFLAEGAGRTVYLHAMHSVVDWFALAKWSPDGKLVRSLSVSPDAGFAEDLGTRLPFEDPFWAGEHPVDWDDYPLPFHPLELAEAALRALFGFNYEGEFHENDPDLEAVVLAGFHLSPTMSTGSDRESVRGTGSQSTQHVRRSPFGWRRRR